MFLLCPHENCLVCWLVCALPFTPSTVGIALPGGRTTLAMYYPGLVAGDHRARVSLGWYVQHIIVDGYAGKTFLNVKDTHRLSVRCEKECRCLALGSN